MNFMYKYSIPLLILGFFTFIAGCSDDDDSNGPSGDNVSLSKLPTDTGGVHIPQVLGSTSAEYGYYVYLPSGYDEVSYNYPLLVFLHGKSEKGDGTSDQDVLDKVLKNGVPNLIENDEWDPTYPMIVISPQYHGDGEGEENWDSNNWGGGNPDHLMEFIEFAINKYRVNTKRVYLTGLSFGGNGVYDYITRSSDSSNYIAAAAPVAAYGKKSGLDNCANTPIWVFVGSSDGSNFTTSTNFVTNYNSQSPAPTYNAKITVYPGAGHNVWTRTYSGDGMGTEDDDYDAFDQSLYDWMFQYERAD